MLLHEKEVLIPLTNDNSNLLKYLSDTVSKNLPKDEIPIRFVITKTDDKSYHCELGLLSIKDNISAPVEDSIFDFNKRQYENTSQFNVVLLVPTGIGAEIGGHSGDSTPIARLLATACDNLITHPNVVNASDLNELPDNGLYVEGSVISRLLMGTIGLQKVRSNRVILIIDKHDEDNIFHEYAVNSASAARAAYGMNIPLVVQMENKILMNSLYSTSGRAVGRIEYFERLINVLNEHKTKYDAIALSSVIKVPRNFHSDYFTDDDMVNPWGGVEAMLTHAVSTMFNVPSAHSPMMESREILDLNVGVVDPRKSAETVSVTYLHCILKGLHKSPGIINNPKLDNSPNLLTATDVSCLVIPEGCVGLPTLAALEQGITVIAVRENKNRMKNKLKDLPFESGKLFYVDNYLEAAGVINALKAGVTPESVRRPLSATTVSESMQKESIMLPKPNVEASGPNFKRNKKAI